jgi:hypothetical protein
VVRRTIIRWTSPEKAKRKIRRPVTARDFNQTIRDFYSEGIWDWTGHIGLINSTEPSCGCKVCQHARFMK